MKNVYFIGIGGIGMSAIARYFKRKGLEVSGYDRTPSELTSKLQEEGIGVHFEDDPSFVPKDVAETLVIYTPAIPSDNAELTYVRENGYRVVKRSLSLGEITRGQECLAVAGTHGKTTTSTLAAHILTESGDGCSAFLGGISKNYGTNLLVSPVPTVVAEADEFDRSFLQLHPAAAVITAMDADHLDIYGDLAHVQEAFRMFASQVTGVVIKKLGLPVTEKDTEAKIHTYHYDDPAADFHAENIRRGALGHYTFDLVRRMDVHFNTPELTYIDDYAHHPQELAKTISSIRGMFPGRKITAIFQPHLYSRTQDLAPEFAEALSSVDKLILLDIYPAREEPIPGVTSELIFKDVKAPEKVLITKEELMETLSKETPEVLVTFGAGNIDRFVEPITQMLQSRYK